MPTWHDKVLSPQDNPLVGLNTGHTLHIIPVRQSDGHIIGYVGVAHDI